MSTQDNNPITYLDFGLLANDSYRNSENRGVNDWKAIGEQDSSTLNSGLQIQNYQNNSHPNHTVIAIAGTNGFSDIADDVAFATGGLTQQVKDALTHVAKTIDAAARNSEDNDIVS